MSYFKVYLPSPTFHAGSSCQCFDLSYGQRSSNAGGGYRPITMVSTSQYSKIKWYYAAMNSADGGTTKMTYSLDDGATWSEYNPDTFIDAYLPDEVHSTPSPVFILNKGQTVRIRFNSQYSVHIIGIPE